MGHGTHNEQRLGQGREAAKKSFKENQSLCQEVELKIKEKIGFNAEKKAISSREENNKKKEVIKV